MNLKGKRIAFIDDEAYRTRLQRENLERAGAEVIFYRDLPEAHTALNSDLKFDLVVLDLGMSPDGMVSPGAQERFGRANGFFLLASLRDRLKQEKTGLIILTNHGSFLEGGENSVITQSVFAELGLSTSGRNIGLYTKLGLPARDLPAVALRILGYCRAA